MTRGSEGDRRETGAEQRQSGTYSRAASSAPSTCASEGAVKRGFARARGLGFPRAASTQRAFTTEGVLDRTCVFPLRGARGGGPGREVNRVARREARGAEAGGATTRSRDRTCLSATEDVRDRGVLGSRLSQRSCEEKHGARRVEALTAWSSEARSEAPATQRTRRAQARLELRGNSGCSMRGHREPGGSDVRGHRRTNRSKLARRIPAHTVPSPPRANGWARWMAPSQRDDARTRHSPSTAASSRASQARRVRSVVFGDCRRPSTQG